MSHGSIPVPCQPKPVWCPLGLAFDRTQPAPGASDFPRPRHTIPHRAEEQSPSLTWHFVEHLRCPATHQTEGTPASPAKRRRKRTTPHPGISSDGHLETPLYRRGGSARGCVPPPPTPPNARHGKSVSEHGVVALVGNLAFSFLKNNIIF